MKPTKAIITESIIKLSKIAPKIFPRIHFFSGITDIKIKKDTNTCSKKISLLSGDFNWIGQSVVIKLEDEEVEKIEIWINKNKVAKAKSNKKSVLPENILNMSSIGIFTFEKDNTDPDTFKMKIKPQLFESCNITLLRFRNATNFLHLDYELNRKITDTIKNISTDQFETYLTFNSLNFFSKKPKLLEIVTPLSQSINTLNNNLNTIGVDANKISKEILKIFNIEYGTRPTSQCAIIYHPEGKEYFQKGAKEDENNLSKIKKDDDFKLYEFKENNDSCFLSDREIESFRNFFITKNKEHNVFMSKIHYGLEKELYQYIDIIWKEIELIFYQINKKIHNTNHIEKDFELLFSSTLKLNMLSKSICELRFYFSGNEQVKKTLNMLTKKITEMNQGVKKRLEVSSSSINIKSIKSTQRNSTIILILTSVQIIFAFIFKKEFFIEIIKKTWLWLN